MKYIRLVLREIRTSRTRFLAIAAIFALGVGFYAGLGSTMPVMKKSMDRYADDCNLYDIRLSSSYGMKPEDSAVLCALDNVSGVYLSKSVDAIVESGATRIMSLRDDVNVPEFVEGRMPESSGECVIDQSKMSGNLAEVGQTVTLSQDNETQTLDMLKTRTFTVVGIVRTPAFPSVSRGISTVGQGSLRHFMYITEQDFDTDYYTEAYITLKSSKSLELYSQAYTDSVQSACTAIESSGLAASQLERVKQSAQSELETAVSELADKRAQAQSELDDAAKKLERAATELRNARSEISDGETQLSQGKAQYEAAKALLSPIELEAVRTQLEQSEIILEQARSRYNSGLSEYNEGLAEYNENKAEAESEFAKAQADIDEAQQKIDTMEAPSLYISTLEDNYGVNAFGQDAERIDNIARVFPIIFFLVAALVCLTTMTRMVDEQRTKIGTLSSLGYGKAAIAMHYLLYSSAAALGGGIFGIALGVAIVPRLIFNTYGIMYTIPRMVFTMDIIKTLTAFVSAFVLSVVVTLWASLESLRSCCAQLMRPLAPKIGKKIILERFGLLWRHMSFTSKVTSRNILRYKKRFFMTVAGITGCCALLLTGFGLKDSISGMIPKQYSEIQNFDMTVYLASDTESAAKCIADNSDDSLYVQNLSTTAKSGGRSLECYTLVARDTQKLEEFINLRERRTGQKTEFPPDGQAVIAEKLSTRLDVGVGDTIQIMRPQGDYVSLTVSGITENYIYSYVYMSPATYESVFKEDVEYNQVFVKSADAENAIKTIIANDDVASAILSENMISTFTDIFDSLNGVVLLLIVSACLLNFVVLYNLTNINIGERVREIATIKVLGFYPRETDAYIYRENIVLTLIGTAAGLVLGKLLHGFVITTAEIDMIMFTRDISVWSYVLSAVLTVVFSAVVNVLMHFKLKKISMTESLKSTE